MEYKEYKEYKEFKTNVFPRYVNDKSYRLVLLPIVLYYLSDFRSVTTWTPFTTWTDWRTSLIFRMQISLIFAFGK